MIDAVQNLIAVLNIKHEHSYVSNVLTISIGASVIENVDDSLTKCTEEDFLKSADAALYKAKYEGRNRAVIQPFTFP